MSSLSTQVNFREPDTFAAGDTLLFQRYLRDYLPQNGWSLLYELRGDTGAAVITFTSTANNDYHGVEVDPPVTSLWVPGTYNLRGFAVNATGERHQIYYGELDIYTNAGGTDNQPTTTHAQRMITLIEASLERLASHEIDESNVQQSQFLRAKRLDLEKQLAINKEIRANEIAQENIRNGKPSGFKIISQMNIVNTGSSRAVNATGNIIP